MKGRRRATLIVVAVLTALTLCSSAQSVLGGVLSDDPERFALGIWGPAFMWLALADAVLVFTPLLIPGDARTLRVLRIAATAVMIPSLGALTWLASTDRLPGLLLPVGLLIAVLGWAGTFGVARLVAIGTMASQPDNAGPVD